MKAKKVKPSSLMMSHGFNSELSEGAVKTPIFLSSTFVFKSAEEGARAFALAYGLEESKEGEISPLIYGRLNQPNLQIAEERLNLWENDSEDCTIFNTFLKPGDLLLCSSPVYGGTDHYLKKVLSQKGIEVIFFNKNQTIEEIIAIRYEKQDKKVGMIYLESPANPTNDLFDISLFKNLAESFSTDENKTLLVVDNTYMGPIWQNPIVHGADLVVYSATKYIGGHSDLIAGACLGSKKLIQEIKVQRTFLGNMSDPHTCWMLTRSLETLEVRMQRQAFNANKIAQYLSKHPMVSKVYFLGNLNPSQDVNQFQIKQKQCIGNGAMIAFDIVGGKSAAYKFLNSLKLAKLAVSLGGTESLVEHPFTMTHADVTTDEKIKSGVTENMIRYSVGVEFYKDLIRDIKQAFEKVGKD